MKNIPERIFLNIQEECMDEFENFEELVRVGGVSWSEHNIYKTDVEYVRKKSLWISTDESYPDYDNSIPLDKRERYIVRVECGSANMKVRYTIAWMSSRYRFNVEMDWVRVTHWMPMPKFDENEI